MTGFAAGLVRDGSMNDNQTLHAAETCEIHAVQTDGHAQHTAHAGGGVQMWHTVRAEDTADMVLAENTAGD